MKKSEVQKIISGSKLFSSRGQILKVQFRQKKVDPICETDAPPIST
jgi:hypothetical protein